MFNYGSRPTATEEVDLISFEPDTLFNFELDANVEHDDTPIVQDDTAPPIVHEIFKEFESSYADDDFNGNTQLIYLKKGDLVRLFNLFDATEDNFRNIISSALHSNYPKDFVISAFREWAKGCKVSSSIEFYSFICELCNDNYEKVGNNEWLFEILKFLPQNQRDYILETYMNNTVNDSVDRTEPALFADLRRKNYRKSDGDGIHVGEFLTDLMKVAVHIDSAQPLYFVKIHSTQFKKPILSPITEAQFKKKMKALNLGSIPTKKERKEIDAWTVYNTGNNARFITFNSITFYSENPFVFSYFQGYEFDFPITFNRGTIKLFIDHIFDIICSKHIELFNYVINWISYIFQNPNGKTNTALVFTSIQGAGKNTFTDTICKLLGNYANKNTNLKLITGNFNASLEFKKLLVCSETQSYLKNKNFDSDIIKSLITEDTVDITKKFRDAYHVENIVNFIFLSNNFAPVKIEEGDRRFFVSEVSGDVSGNAQYFKALYASFTPEFYENLLGFFMNRNIRRWDPTEIPMSRAKQAIIEYSQPTTKLFIKAYLEQFIKGMIRANAYPTYKIWCKENDHEPVKPETFRTGLLEFCESYRPNTKEGPRPTYYILRRDAYKAFGVENAPPREIIEVDDDDDDDND